ncbi:hypothetical protein B0H65DRAFT_460149 [Neurospora tetraspora]|uniref:Uncharacterized protein n=1 Tax=Neurospora tetraspora TaxID=94610 RepID=A0AAE0MS74_9PEZI|nr:hypothetical protein B0H65DRAFT_460149 [Neurospora tetraspora]
MFLAGLLLLAAILGILGLIPESHSFKSSLPASDCLVLRLGVSSIFTGFSYRVANLWSLSPTFQGLICGGMGELGGGWYFLCGEVERE